MSRTPAEIELDRDADLFRTNLINSLRMFAKTSEELEAMTSPVFRPIYELEHEAGYAFSPPLVATVFRNNLLDVAYQESIIAFKQVIDRLPPETWNYAAIRSDQRWIDVRQMANTLLRDLKVEGKEYIDDYEIEFDQHGNVVKKGKRFL